MKKFWIVEYVDVSAPKAERSELCSTFGEARRKSLKREARLHFCDLVSFAGEGFCDSLRNTHLFDNELGAQQ